MPEGFYLRVDPSERELKSYKEDKRKQYSPENWANKVYKVFSPVVKVWLTVLIITSGITLFFGDNFPFRLLVWNMEVKGLYGAAPPLVVFLGLANLNAIIGDYGIEPAYWYRLSVEKCMKRYPFAYEQIRHTLVSLRTGDPLVEAKVEVLACGDEAYGVILYQTVGAGHRLAYPGIARAVLEDAELTPAKNPAVVGVPSRSQPA
jgi:hypothetical protein